MPIHATFSPLFTSRTLKVVAFQALAVAIYACLPLWLEFRNSSDQILTMPSDIHAALGIILGWLLTFRSNVSYSRWWEARTHWGTLVNASRNLATKVCDLVKAGDVESQRFRYAIIGFCYALKDHLRSDADIRKLKGYEDNQSAPTHLPSFLVAQIYGELRELRRQTKIEGSDLIVIDQELSRFLDVCGACEKIQNTRLIGSYRTFARQCVILYLGTFPWGMVHDYGWWAIPLTAVVSYFMIGMETVAENVELPFGYDEDDLDLDGICRTIEKSVSEIFDRHSGRR